MLSFPEEIVLTIKDLAVFYENAIAVNNVTLSCRKGKITGIFGANSAGKSTLMNSISGLILDMRDKEARKGGERISWFGEIIYEGVDILNMKPSDRARKGIILCPERRQIFAESSSLENLKIGGYLTSRKETKENLRYVFQLFPELEKLTHREAGFLSGGEQQMLAIGRALMANPKLLLLDEPLMGLAPAVELRLAKAIKTINQQRGIAVIITEQYARPLFPIIDYGYVLENGSVVLDGSADFLSDNPDVLGAYFGM